MYLLVYSIVFTLFDHGIAATFTLHLCPNNAMAGGDTSSFSPLFPWLAM
jgi:hypothetical protein